MGKLNVSLSILHCQICIAKGRPWTFAEWLFTSKPGIFGLVKGWAMPTGVGLVITLTIMSCLSLPCVRMKGHFQVKSKHVTLVQHNNDYLRNFTALLCVPFDLLHYLCRVTDLTLSRLLEMDLCPSHYILHGNHMEVYKNQLWVSKQKCD